MPAPDLGPRLMPSVIDRLFDPNLIGRADVPGYTEREMIRAVRADLEDLLNTRHRVRPVPGVAAVRPTRVGRPGPGG
jgi:predicted component of type VI protein secretion system